MTRVDLLFLERFEYLCLGLSREVEKRGTVKKIRIRKPGMVRLTGSSSAIHKG